MYKNVQAALLLSLFVFPVCKSSADSIDLPSTAPKAPVAGMYAPPPPQYPGNFQGSGQIITNYSVNCQTPMGVCQVNGTTPPSSGMDCWCQNGANSVQGYIP